MKGTGKVCIRILCAIFVGVVLGCSGGASGGGVGDGGNGNPPVKTFCEENHPDYTHPAYMNVTADFGGQRFVESNADWFHDGQNDKNTKFTKHYDDANKYINCKVAELQKLWQEENTSSDLSNKIGTALESFNNGTSINQKIENNYKAIAPVFANFEKNLNGTAELNTYRATYHLLAANAYNQSIGAITPSTRKTNKEIKNSDECFFFESELAKANLNYNDLTDNNNIKAKEIMTETLNTISTRTGTSAVILKKIVELALFNESLYGLNDFARECKVNNASFSTERTLETLYDLTIAAKQNISTQSIDDGRTM